MTFAPPCVTAAFVASKVFLAELTSRPRTSAAIMLIIPAPTFTASFESALR
jgi:hypothetical protein